jgi:signal transduction histidine kinase
VKALNRRLNAWLHLLLTFPFAIRVSILVVCFLFSLTIYLLTFPITHNGYIVIIPVATAAWIFKKEGCVIISSTWLLILFIYHTHRLGTPLWPLTFVLPFFSGVLLLLITGFIILTLRNLVDLADAARLQAQQAAQQLAGSCEQQQQLNQLKTQFILNVNHELRSPLTVISGYLAILQLILEQNGQLDRTAHGPYLESAIQKCEELGATVNRVLDMQKPDDQGESFKFREILVADTVRDVLEQLDFIDQKAHSVQMDVSANIAVWADAHGLYDVLHNLLSNAFKYSPPGTLVVISAALNIDAAYARHGTPTVSICVKDSGPGIPADEISLLFSPFVRLKRDLAGPVQGTGLGLYISKNIVEAMSGRIWVESTGIAGEGSSFCFALPCAADSITISNHVAREAQYSV